MTLGRVSHDMRDLTLRVAALEGNAKAAFKRLMIWSFVSALGSSILIFIFSGL